MMDDFSGYIHDVRKKEDWHEQEKLIAQKELEQKLAEINEARREQIDQIDMAKRLECITKADQISKKLQVEMYTQIQLDEINLGINTSATVENIQKAIVSQAKKICTAMEDKVIDDTFSRASESIRKLGEVIAKIDFTLIIKEIPYIDQSNQYSLTCDYSESTPSIFTRELKAKPSCFRVVQLSSYLKDSLAYYTIIFTNTDSTVREQFKLKEVGTNYTSSFIINQVYELEMNKEDKEKFMLKLVTSDNNK